MLVALAAVVLAALAYLLLPGDLSALRERAQGLIESFSPKDAAMRTPPVAAAPEPVFPPGATPQQVMNPQARASIEMAPAQLAAPAAAANQPLRFVVARESSIEVRDRDNKVVFAQRSPAGSEHAVGGQGPFSLVIGNAQGVTLYWRGQVVDLVPHTKGEVARLVLE
jgi:cytoskeleton protein RodZ